MCTVSIVPVGSDQFILTTNRDERKARLTFEPVEEERGGQVLTYPKDAKSGGSWVCMSDRKVCCLLNGAFEYHRSAGPYRKSRGLVLLEMCEGESTRAQFEQMNLHNIEQFTIVSIELLDAPVLMEYRWDGKEKHVKELDSKSRWIWSSATLYSAEIRAMREEWFALWSAQNETATKESILEFHRMERGGNKSDTLVMEREEFGLKTVSITQVFTSRDKTTMDYHDLLAGKVTKRTNEYRKSSVS